MPCTSPLTHRGRVRRRSLVPARWGVLGLRGVLGPRDALASRLVASWIGASWSALDVGGAAAQESRREIAERVHREGGYASDIELRPELDTTLVDWLDGLSFPDWMRLGGLSELAAPIAYLLLGLAILVGGGLVLYGFVLSWTHSRMKETADEATQRGAEAVQVDPLLLAVEQTPQEFAHQGRYREAIHALFLQALEKAGALEGRGRGRTAREIVHGLSGLGRGAAALTELLSLTELVWWGARPATYEQYQSALALVASVPATETRA